MIGTLHRDPPALPRAVAAGAAPTPRTASGVVQRWWSTGGGSELVRSAAMGGISTAVYSMLFYLLVPTGSLTANLAATIVSTVLGTELHRRVTFRRGERLAWATAQWQSGGLAAVGLVATSLVLGAVEVLFPGTAWWKQILLVNGTTGLIGLVRYMALRGWVFGRTDG